MMEIDSSLFTGLSLYLSICVGMLSLVSAVAGILKKERTEKICSFSSIVLLWVLEGFLGLAVALRWIEVGHEPWQTIYEVLVLCAAFLVLSYIGVRYALREFRKGLVSKVIFNVFTAVVSAFTIGLLMYAKGKDDSGSFLPPALKSYWMAPHVVAYTFAYAMLFIACAAVFTWWIVSLIQKLKGGKVSRETKAWLEDFDRFSYALVAVGFPFLTAALLMGSLWGQEAWGSYWGWDSKEVAALISWIVYVIYLHLRIAGGWKGGKLYFVLFVGALSIAVCFLLFSYLPASFSSLHRYAE